MASSSRPSASLVKKEECTNIFRVPSHLVESYGGVMPSQVTFITDEYQKNWHLSVEKFKDDYFFTNGWNEFEEEVGLQARRFLMYNPDAALSKQKGKTKVKGRKLSGNVNAHETTSRRGENKDKGPVVEKRPSFWRVMKKHHQYRLDIPQDFVQGTGLREGVVINLKNCEGREWPANVTARGNRVSLTGGWCDFVMDNNLMIGSKISFGWHSEGTVQTKILEVGSKKKLLERKKTIDQEDSDDIFGANGSGVDKRWRFSKYLKKGHASYLDLPMSFSTVFGKPTGGKINLIDRQKRTWPVRVLKYSSCSSFKMSRGWIDFLVGNKASVGSKLVLKSVPGCNNVIKAQIIDSGNGQKEPFVKRARGRPPSGFSKLAPSP